MVSSDERREFKGSWDKARAVVAREVFKGAEMPDWVEPLLQRWWCIRKMRLDEGDGEVYRTAQRSFGNALDLMSAAVGFITKWTG